MSIHIVTHCYAIEKPQYAVFLQAQLSSLVLFPCKVPVQYTLYYNFEDTAVTNIIKDFGPRLSSNVTLFISPIEKNELFKRAIGRNTAALSCKQELIWFADADYYFGLGCLNSLWDNYSNCLDNIHLIWPTSSQIHINHEVGDKFWKKNLNTIGIIDPEIAGNFKRTKYIKAIGGCQIVPRWYANVFGYLNGSKWTEPEENVTEFRNTREDVKFRKRCLERGLDLPIKLPNLYRFRHTEHGWAEP